MQGWRRWGFLLLEFDLGEGKEKGEQVEADGCVAVVAVQEK
jgi:hypothetical protein